MPRTRSLESESDIEREENESLLELNAELVDEISIAQSQREISSKVILFDQFRCFFVDVVVILIIAVVVVVVSFVRG